MDNIEDFAPSSERTSMLQQEFAGHLEKFIAYFSDKRCPCCCSSLSKPPGETLPACINTEHLEIYRMIVEAQNSLDKRRPRTHKHQLRMDVD